MAEETLSLQKNIDGSVSVMSDNDLVGSIYLLTLTTDGKLHLEGGVYQGTTNFLVDTNNDRLYVE